MSIIICTFARKLIDIVIMAKKYEIPRDEPRLVSEPAAYALQYDYEHELNIVAREDDAEWDDSIISSSRLFVSDDELRRMGRDCINSTYVSAEDTIRHFMNM